MFKKFNFKSRRLLLIMSFFVLLISLSACSSAGSPKGKLNVDDIYTKAGNYEVKVGELWDNLKWDTAEILENKKTEVILKNYFNKVQLVVEKAYNELTDDEKKLFGDDYTIDQHTTNKEKYEERLVDYVVEDIYNFSFSNKLSIEEIDSVDEYDAKKLIAKYCDEIYTTYNIREINNISLKTLCTDATLENGYYLIIAKNLKSIYYTSLAKEILAYEVLEEEIKDAYDNRDTSDEDDLGYFTKSDFTSKYKSDFANQSDVNMILIRFSTEDEFSSTLRSFGLRQYNSKLVYIHKPEGMNFSDYCDYYDDLTTNDLKNSDKYSDLNELQIALVYIQMYNYLYGGYRDMIYDTSYSSLFNNVDLTSITKTILLQDLTVEQEKEEMKKIIKSLNDEKANYDVDTFYTREEIDKIDSSFNKYIYETLSLPYNDDNTDDSLCYSTDTQSYNSSYWIAYKFEQGSDEYADVYYKGIVDDDLYKNIDENEELKSKLENLLKIDEITENEISSAVKERTAKVEIKIYDEALEISYAKDNSDYSKTYGSAPNSNVIATLKYEDKTWNLNIVEDLEDSNACEGGVYNTLEAENGITTAIDILSRKVVKDTKAYAETAKDIDSYKEQLELVLTAFSNDYYSTSGYSSSIGKYNFMMLYFHTANIDEIIRDVYRVNGAAAKLLTNYNSDELLDFFKSYTDKIYENYFSISGSRLIVYLDADDDSKKDEVSTWTDYQKALAKQLVLEINEELASITGSHSETLTSIVTEINESARAKFEENPIAPENKWAVYRKAGLNVEVEEVSATNDTTSLDFALKARMLEIFESPSYSLNNTTPTEYIEDLKDVSDVLETNDGYNLLLITSASFQTSAEFKAEDDKLGLYENIKVYYNDEYHQIGNIYNDGKQLTKEQIRLYVLEYVSNSTSNLLPTALSDSITNFLSPVVTRYRNDATQREILIYFIENYGGTLTFTNNQERYSEILRINRDSADDYINVYFEKDTTGKLQTYENWWTDIQNIVNKILLTEGEN